MSKPKIILVHGNGGTKASDFWFPKVKTELESAGLKVIAETMPDRVLARSSKWLPFLHDTLKADENTIIVGHSSGAVAAMRYAETTPIYGSVLVGASYTDLGDRAEKMSGYFNEPWDWRTIKANQKWIEQFASTDDPYIPIEEARFVHGTLGTTYHEDTDRGHYLGTDFPELVSVIKQRLGIQ